MRIFACMSAGVLALAAASAACPAQAAEKGDGETAVREARTRHAKAAVEASVRLANAKCFYAAWEYLKIAELVDPDLAAIAKIREYLSFLKPVSWRNMPKAPDPSSMPESSDLEEKGHAAAADAVSIHAFWKRGLDRLLDGLLDDLDRAAAGHPRSIPLGEAFMTVAGMSDLVPAWGNLESADRARKSLGKLGWKFGTYRFKWPRWLNPDEVAEAAALEAFEKERDQRTEKAISACKAEAEVRDLGGPSPVAASMGLSLPRYATRHFEVETSAPRGTVAEIAGLLEKGLSEAARLAGRQLPDRFESPVAVIVLDSEEDFGKFVDGVEELGDEAKAAVKNQAQGYADYDRSAFALCGEARAPDFHASVLMGGLKIALDRLGLHNLPLWAWAGISDLVAVGVLGSVAPSIGFEKPKAQPEFNSWYNHFSWRKAMAEEMKAGRSPSAGTVLGRDSEFETAPVQRAYMYCMAAVLLADPARFEKFRIALSEEGWKQGRDGEWNALAAAGLTVEAFGKEVAKALAGRD